jgi:hypothetical protein
MRPRLQAITWAAAFRAALAGVLLVVGAQCVLAQSNSDGTWNPFKPPDNIQPRRKQPGPEDKADLQREQPPAGHNRPVESSDLTPVMAPDASGLPLNLWGGLDMGELERLFSTLDLPPRSPALHQLWRRMMLASSVAAPSGAPSPEHFLALRLEALYRSGLLADMAKAQEGSGSASPLAKILLARKDIGLGAREAGCRTVRELAAMSAGLPGRLKGEAQLLVGYCAAVLDAATADLTASLAREEGLTSDLALTVLDRIASGSKAKLPLPQHISLLDFRFLQLTGQAPDLQVLGRAEPALLVALAGADGDVRVQTAAAEAALRINAMSPEAVAQVYRRQPEPSPRATPGREKAVDPMLLQAQLYRAIEATQNPGLKARLLRTLLEEAHRAGMHMQTARMLAPLLGGLWPSPETGTLAEPAVEIFLAAGDYAAARRWAETAASLQHWLALIDVADPSPRGGRSSGLAYLDDLALRGRLSAEVLHRLATVVDALDIDVPRAIWEAAGRTPQPTSGYLPETGVLADLKRAAERKEAGRTALLAMRAFGAHGADTVNILALGDAVRGLKRAGLEADARRLALEGLFAVWPRTLGR